jgi:hypothetical protein
MAACLFNLLRSFFNLLQGRFRKFTFLPELFAKLSQVFG